MRSHRKLVAITLLLLFLLLPTSFLSFSAAASFSIDPMFSIVWITDTQCLSERLPLNFDKLCNWIVDYSDLLNIKAVIHTGDIVEHPSSTIEWIRANHSMSILLNNNIPYCWDAGNHDLLPTTWHGRNFTAFNTAIMQQKGYWISDKFDGENTAIHFKASDWDFLLINVEFQPKLAVLLWVKHLLELYPMYHTIIATHAYLNGTGEHEKWTNDFDEPYFEQILATHSNVFMTLNGHFMIGNRTSRTFIGNHHELFFNYQQTDGGQGDSRIRILTFSKKEDTIIVNTVNTVTNQFMADPENKFTLDIPFFENPVATENLNATKSYSAESQPKTLSVAFPILISILSVFSFVITRKKMRKTPNVEPEPS